MPDLCPIELYDTVLDIQVIFRRFWVLDVYNYSFFTDKHKVDQEHCAFFILYW